MAVLEAFGEEIWLASGPTVVSAGFRYPTRMAVVRLQDGGLFVWSPVGASAELRREVEALGPVRFLVAPNSLHAAFLPEWRAAHPEALLYGAPGSREKRTDIAFDADLDDEPPAAWVGQIDQVVVRGNVITTEVVFFHRQSGVVLVTDLIQHFPRGWFKGLQALIARLDGMTGPAPRVPQKFRMAFTDRKAARASIKRVLAWPANKVVMAHSEPVLAGGKHFLADMFSWLG